MLKIWRKELVCENLIVGLLVAQFLFFGCIPQVPRIEVTSALNVNFYHDPGLTSCLECHLDRKPAVPVGGSQFDHNTIGAKDCFECHKNAGIDWSANSGGVPVTVTMQPPLGTPLTAITINHPTVQTGMSCVSCHTNYSNTNSIRGFDHTEGLVLASSGTAVSNSCYYCHFSPNQVISSALTNNNTRNFQNGQIVLRPNLHHGETLTNSSSCLDCHTASASPSWNSNTKTWTTGGKWNGG